MKVVIDIPENDYKLACNHPDALIACYAHYIKEGTVLPNNHGRLIDADALIARMESDAEQMEEPIAQMFTYAAINDVKHSETVIEAERRTDEQPD